MSCQLIDRRLNPTVLMLWNTDVSKAPFSLFKARLLGLCAILKNTPVLILHVVYGSVGLWETNNVGSNFMQHIKTAEHSD